MAQNLKLVALCFLIASVIAPILLFIFLYKFLGEEGKEEDDIVEEGEDEEKDKIVGEEEDEKEENQNHADTASPSTPTIKDEDKDEKEEEEEKEEDQNHADTASPSTPTITANEKTESSTNSNGNDISPTEGNDRPTPKTTEKKEVEEEDEDENGDEEEFEEEVEGEKEDDIVEEDEDEEGIEEDDQDSGYEGGARAPEASQEIPINEESSSQETPNNEESSSTETSSKGAYSTSSTKLPAVPEWNTSVPELEKPIIYVVEKNSSVKATHIRFDFDQKFRKMPNSSSFGKNFDDYNYWFDFKSKNLIQTKKEELPESNDEKITLEDLTSNASTSQEFRVSKNCTMTVTKKTDSRYNIVFKNTPDANGEIPVTAVFNDRSQDYFLKMTTNSFAGNEDFENQHTLESA